MTPTGGSCGEYRATRAVDPAEQRQPRSGLITDLMGLLEQGKALRRSKLAPWAVAEREADLQLHINAIIKQLNDLDEQHDAFRHITNDTQTRAPWPVSAAGINDDTAPLPQVNTPMINPSAITTATDAQLSGQQRVSTPSFTLTDEGVLLHLRWKNKLLLNESHIRASISAVISFSASGRRPLLVHLGTISGVNHAARGLILADTCSTRTAILGHDPVDEVISGFSYGSLTPTRYFTNEDLARHWLLGSRPH